VKSNINLQQDVQNEILDILESNRKKELVKSSKIEQARLIVSLRKKYKKQVKAKFD